MPMDPGNGKNCRVTATSSQPLGPSTAQLSHFPNMPLDSVADKCWGKIRKSSFCDGIILSMYESEISNISVSETISSGGEQSNNKSKLKNQSDTDSSQPVTIQRRS